MELIRYIHLNPLRASLVKDLKELDKYPWTGHSAIIGRRKNPLVPEIKDPKSGISEQVPSVKGGLFVAENQVPDSLLQQQKMPSPRNPCNAPAPLNRVPFQGVQPGCQEKLLAEKTIEDLLLHFAETKRVAIKRYREFVEKGIKQGTREDLQGGGLVRSAGGDTAGLLGRKAEEREKGDARILGSGDFVDEVLDNSNESYESYELRKRNKISLDDLIQRVMSDMPLKMSQLKSQKRDARTSKIRSIISFLAVSQLGMSATTVGDKLGITGMAVGKCVDRAEKRLDTQQIIAEYLQ